MLTNDDREGMADTICSTVALAKVQVSEGGGCTLDEVCS